MGGGLVDLGVENRLYVHLVVLTRYDGRIPELSSTELCSNLCLFTPLFLLSAEGK